MHITIAANVFLNSNDTELANIVLCKMYDFWKMDSKSVYNFVKNFCPENVTRHCHNLPTMLHNFFKKIFANWQALPLSWIQKDAILVFIFGLWKECGLYQSWQDIDWGEVQLSATLEIFAREDMVSILGKVMGLRESLTFLLLLCQDPEEMVHLLQQLQSMHWLPIRCGDCFGNYLVKMIKKLLGNWRESTDALQSWWETIFKVLGNIQIGYTKLVPHFVLDTIVEHSTYRTRKSFHVYSMLQEMMWPEHPLHEKLSDLLTENLCIDLEHLSVMEWTISTVEFLALLNSSRCILEVGQREKCYFYVCKIFDMAIQVF